MECLLLNMLYIEHGGRLVENNNQFYKYSIARSSFTIFTVLAFITDQHTFKFTRIEYLFDEFPFKEIICKQK